MKITAIRHGLVDMPWKKKYTSVEYDTAWSNYDHCDIVPIQRKYQLDPGTKVYVTGFKRTQQTARQFLGAEEYHVVHGLADEVPLRSFKDSKTEKSRKLMNFFGRVQWYFPEHRQEEHRKDTYKRAVSLIRFLEKDAGGDCAIVCHGFFLRTLGRAMKRCGYKVKGKPFWTVPNLCVMTGEKKDA